VLAKKLKNRNLKLKSTIKRIFTLLLFNICNAYAKELMYYLTKQIFNVLIVINIIITLVLAEYKN
jgi:hypothetical protein